MERKWWDLVTLDGRRENVGGQGENLAGIQLDKTSQYDKFIHDIRCGLKLPCRCQFVEFAYLRNLLGVLGFHRCHSYKTEKTPKLASMG